MKNYRIKNKKQRENTLERQRILLELTVCTIFFFFLFSRFPRFLSLSLFLSLAFPRFLVSLLPSLTYARYELNSPSSFFFLSFLFSLPSFFSPVNPPVAHRVGSVSRTPWLTTMRQNRDPSRRPRFLSCIHPRTWCAPMNGCISGVGELVTRYLAPRFSRACFPSPSSPPPHHSPALLSRRGGAGRGIILFERQPELTRHNVVGFGC